MFHELEQLTRPISQITREELDDEQIKDGLRDLDEALNALGALTAAYRDNEWHALMDYDQRVMAVIEPLTRAAVALNVHQPAY